MCGGFARPFRAGPLSSSRLAASLLSSCSLLALDEGGLAPTDGFVVFFEDLVGRLPMDELVIGLLESLCHVHNVEAHIGYVGESCTYARFSSGSQVRSFLLS
jgi:hypothetical protein